MDTQEGQRPSAPPSYPILNQNPINQPPPYVVYPQPLPYAGGDGGYLQPPVYDRDGGGGGYQEQPQQILEVPQQPQPIIIEVPQPSHADMTMTLYCAGCIVLFIPFGAFIGLGVMCCYWQGEEREKIPREITAYRVLLVCMIVNFIWSILVIAMNS